MLDSIGNKFIHDERKRHRNIGADDERIGFNDKRPSPLGTAGRRRDFGTKISKVPIKHYRSDIVVSVELLMNGGNGHDTGSGAVKLTSRGACGFGLHAKKA